MIKRKLNEATPSEVMQSVAKWAQNTYPKYGATETEGPKDSDAKTIFEPRDFLKEIPCIVYLADNQQHYEQVLKDDQVTDDLLNNFGETIVKFFNDSLLFSDKSNYTATLFVKQNGNQSPKDAPICREAKVINGTATVKEYLNRFEINYEITDSEGKTTNLKPNVFTNSNTQAKKLTEKIIDSLKEIELPKPTLDAIVKSERVKELGIDDEFCQVILNNSDVPKVSITNYTVLEIVSTEEKFLVEATDNEGTSQQYVYLSEIKEGNFYEGHLDLSQEFANCLIKIQVKQLTGNEDAIATDSLSIYTTVKKWQEWAQSHGQRVEESLRGHKIKNYNYRPLVDNTTQVTVQAYDMDRKLFNKVIVPFSNIKNIKDQIYRFVNNSKVFFIDAYDNIGVCYFQAERMLDEQNCYIWNVLKDDFYKKPIEYHFTQINEDTDSSTHSNKWLVTVIFDSKDGDLNISDRHLKVTAEDEYVARKYAEQYIRKMALQDENWKEASVDSIIEYEGDT